MESLQRFQGRFGRRDGVLLVIGALDMIFALNLMIIDNPNNDRIYGSILPLKFWAVAWVLAAMAAWVSIFWEHDRLGFSFSVTILTCWGILAVIAWVQGVNPNGWLAATFFLVLDGLILIPSSWPEPRRLVLSLVDDTFPDAVITADNQGTITGWLGSAEKIFGWTSDEAIGQSVQIIIPARYRLAHSEAIERCRQTGKSALAGKILSAHGLRRDGTEFPVHVLIGIHHTEFGIAFSTTISDQSGVV